MGAAASTPAGLAAFCIARAEHERLQEGYYSDAIGDIPPEDLSRRVHDVFVRALEQDAGLSQLIVARWIAQTVAEQGVYLESFLGAVLKQDKKLRPKSAVAADYSKSFSGSAADTKAEKDAAALMRNEGGQYPAHEDDESKDVGDPLLCPPKLGRDARDLNGKSLDRILLRRSAPWLRFMSASDCALYAHPLTKEIVSVRPEEYDESSDIARGESTKGSVSKKSAVAAVDIAGGLPTCTAATLIATIDDIISSGETPLILDPHNEQAVRTFFQYKGRLADISSITVPFAKSGMKLTDHAERCRATLVGAVKSGSTFALYLGDLTQEHAELKNIKFFKRDVFPLELFQNGGLKLLDTYQGKPRFESVFREEDLEQGQAIAREGYRAVIITALSPGEHTAKLAECIPLAHCKAVFFTN